jgi:hypothetical protein
LARLGHTCFGIDYSPASIEYAVATAKRDRLDCVYNCQDIRLADFPGNVDLVQLIYGEFNIFRPADVAKLLDKSWQSLKTGGALLLEPHTYRMVKKLGKQPSTWYSSSGGLYFDGEHVVLRENFWDEGSHTTTVRYYAIQARTGHVLRYAQSFQAYLDSEYRTLLIEHGFSEIEFRRGLSDQYPQIGLLAIVARNPFARYNSFLYLISSTSQVVAV